MADERTFTVEELCRMSPMTFGAIGACVPTVKDPENITPEVTAKLMQLARESQLSAPADMKLVNEKLLEPSNRESPSSPASGNTTPPMPTEEEWYRMCLPYEMKEYHALLADGGHPTHNPEELTLYIHRNPDKQSAIISYWHKEAGHGFSLLEAQHAWWKQFRKSQSELREACARVQKFDRYCLRVQRYLAEKGLGDSLNLSADPKLQSELDTWRELQYFEHEDADQSQVLIAKSAQALTEAKERLQTAIREGQDAQKIEWLRDWHVASHKGRHGTNVMRAQNHAIRLHWIDEQVELLASGSIPILGTGAQTGLQSTSAKRKKRADDAIDESDPPRKRIKGVALGSSFRSRETLQGSSEAGKPGIGPTSRAVQEGTSAVQMEGEESLSKRNNVHRRYLRPRKCKRQEKARGEIAASPSSRRKNGQKAVASQQGRHSLRKHIENHQKPSVTRQEVRTRSGRISKPTMRWAPS